MTPTTKAGIAARVQELNAQLQARKATPASQSEEREALFDSCDRNGGHVMEMRMYGDSQAPAGADFSRYIAYGCCFCEARAGATQEEISRNLVSA